MKYVLLIFFTVSCLSVKTFAEPKFRYVDTENKNKTGDENANKPPPKPAYYDAYKKNMVNKPSQMPQQNVNPPLETQQTGQQLSEEEYKKIADAVNKAKEEMSKPKNEKPKPSDDYNPTKAQPKVQPE